jgi:hypothetical protein
LASQLRLISRPRARFQEALHVARPGEDIEIFGGFIDAGLMNERKGATNQERDLCPTEDFHGVPVKQP